MNLLLGVRPAMPTAQVVQKFEQLHHSILYMFDLKKTVDKMEAEHRTRMQRVQMANRDGANRVSIERTTSRDRRLIHNLFA